MDIVTVFAVVFGVLAFQVAFIKFAVDRVSGERTDWLVAAIVGIGGFVGLLGLGIASAVYLGIDGFAMPHLLGGVLVYGVLIAAWTPVNLVQGLGVASVINLANLGLAWLFGLMSVGVPT